MSIITAKDLCLWYGNFQALKNINIDIPEHSITALIGPSGCGKSTFLKTLNRMQDLVPGVKITGDVTYNGQSIFDAEVNNLRKEVGMVFQKPNPFPMSITIISPTAPVLTELPIMHSWMTSWKKPSAVLPFGTRLRIV